MIFHEGRHIIENKLPVLRGLEREEQVLGSEKASPTAWLRFAEHLQSEDANRAEHVLTSVVFGGDLPVTA